MKPHSKKLADKWSPIFTSRNSICGSARIKDLNKQVWWMDNIDHENYLHVEGPEGTAHRVWCKHSRDARIACYCGIFYWVWNRGDRPQYKFRNK